MTADEAAELTWAKERERATSETKRQWRGDMRGLLWVSSRQIIQMIASTTDRGQA
jgi:predicted RNA-binding protein with PIN domain